eukprot:CAMPEP_0180572618 /NCGR_PEP_ID=MMETSP1037_2-20121125/9341_1 /TAXON_ID=632150 /ORGANISM="Azadinium spinosum, Strain 3D9" /LENGTH=56 /DNA_ID=CAMNT_0022589999 /DNA_START=622 /DNA_END=792 /DNA_ORIENTATION=-
MHPRGNGDAPQPVPSEDGAMRRLQWTYVAVFDSDHAAYLPSLGLRALMLPETPAPI